MGRVSSMMAAESNGDNVPRRAALMDVAEDEVKRKDPRRTELMEMLRSVQPCACAEVEA